VAVTNPAKFPGVNVEEAKKFAAYLRKPETQAWISNYGIGSIDGRPLFFPVTVPN
jgi:ABC-type tungstate transport system permease subunit